MNTLHDPSHTPWYYRLGLKSKFILIFYLVTLVALGVVGAYGFQNASNAHMSRAEEIVQNHTRQVSQTIIDFMQLTRNDLDFFANHASLRHHLYWQDMHDNKMADQWLVVTLNDWQGFINSYDYLFKVSFLKNDGRESLTIRRDPVTRQVQALTEQALQDWSSDPFFLEAKILNQTEYHVSNLDLNREQGHIEKPLIPVIRLIRRVIGANKVQYGFVVITLFADTFLDQIRKASKLLNGGDFSLLDPDGYFLFHTDQEKIFGNLLKHEENINNSFPNIINTLQQQTEGTLLAQKHLIAYKRLLPHTQDPKHYWILLVAMDTEVVLKDLDQFTLLFAGLMLLMLILIGLMAHYYLGNLVQPLLFVTQQLHRLGQGQVKPETIPYRSHDEIRQMLNSTERLFANMNTLVKQADAIAHGDFSNEVSLLSEEDRLGGAINNMTAMLRKERLHNEHQLWLKEGISQLNQALTSDLTPPNLAEQALLVLAHHLEAVRGVFYLYLPQEKSLELLASYMFTERHHQAHRFQLGEGAAGQAAKEQKPIVLSIPNWDEAPMIITGTTSTPSRYTCTWPLLREEQLLGVLELNGFLPLNALRQEFLNEASKVISSFLFMSLQRQRIQELFTEAQTAREMAQEQASRLAMANALMEQQQQKLQQQTEELQQTNIQMEEQHQQLQQQTEELQQTNTQMEEQHQQLQQQSEELQQTNSQMEEQQQLLQQQSMILQQKNEELTLSQHELDQRARLLEESNRYKSEFLANMSHELRTPLNSIIVLSKMLAANEHHDLDEESIKQARIIHTAGHELLRLINDILDLSKIEAGRIDLQRESCSSRDLVTEWQEFFAATATEKNIAFIVDDQYQNNLYTDRHQLSQVVRNLLSNAFKFTRQGSVRLILRTNPEQPDELLIDVHDTGIGIPSDKQKIIFEAFQQVNGTISREFGGTGLGLSISVRLMEVLGGRISLQSEDGQGSTFTLHLPLQNQEMVQPRPNTPPKQTPESQHPHPPLVTDDRTNLLPGERPILVIDDDPSFCNMLIMLNRPLGFKTITALNGADGLAMAKNFKPLGIILDLGLPDCHGMEILHQLKSNRESSSIPVYIVTGQEKQDLGQEQGALGWLQKPVHTPALIEMMNAFQPEGNVPARILMVFNNVAEEKLEQALMDLEGVEVIRTKRIADALAILEKPHESPVQVVISDFHLADGQTAIDLGAHLREHHSGLPFIVYSNTLLSEEQEIALRACTNTIIQQSSQAPQRLLMGVGRFLRHIHHASTPKELQKTPSSQEIPTSLRDRTILVVDDDPRNLYVITAALERHGGRVLQAMNGKKALELLAQQPVNLILMDIMMPELSGYQTIEDIRANPRLQGVPIIALTAKATKEDRQKCLSVGANDYLSKPVDYDLLINMVRIWSEPHT